MSFSDAKELHNTIIENIETIKKLFQKAHKMQDSIAELQEGDVKKIMTDNFNDIIETINHLVKNTNELFGLLENYMD